LRTLHVEGSRDVICMYILPVGKSQSPDCLIPMYNWSVAGLGGKSIYRHWWLHQWSKAGQELALGEDVVARALRASLLNRQITDVQKGDVREEASRQGKMSKEKICGGSL
jgi:hypothetical protein